MRTSRGRPLALFIALAIALGEVPALAAAPDLGEVRRRFVAAVQSSDRAGALAEASLEDLLQQTAKLAGGDHQKQLDAMQKLLKALRDFKVERARIVTRELDTSEAISRYSMAMAQASQSLAIGIVVGVVTIGASVPVFAVASELQKAQAAVGAIGQQLAAVETALNDLVELIGGLQTAEANEKRRLSQSGQTSEAIDRSLQAAAASLADLRAALTSLHEARGATQSAQARLQAPPPPPSLTSFDGFLGSAFTVHLDSGKATVGPSEATLEGGVTVSPKSDPSLKLSVSGHVVLKANGGGSSSGPAGSAIDQSAFRATVLGGGQQIGTWVSLEGQGSARITGFGPAVITIPNVALQSQSSAIMFTGGEAAFRGCTHTLAAGSGLTTSQVLFEGSLKCGPWSLTASSMGIDKTSVAGGGTLTAWSKRFTMTYSASGDALSARGSLSGADTPWARLPGWEAEYKVDAPRLDLKLEGPALSPTFGAGRVSVRSTAKKPDGNPWASASLTPDVVVVPAPPTDGIPVPFPVLPAPSDVEKAARDACEAGARRTLAGQALQHALDVCRSGHPSPPSLPSLPRTISLKVGEVLR
jgi:hypothetical protein